MAPDLLILALSAFIPFVLAFAWFHPALFGGSKWSTMAAIPDHLATRPVSKLGLGLSILLNFFVAMGLFTFVVHQGSVFSLLGGDITEMQSGPAYDYLQAYGDRHLSFGHGALHGFYAWLCFALPLLGYVKIFEHKTWKYFWVYSGYWLISLILMGGVICQWGYQWIV